MLKTNLLVKAVLATTVLVGSVPCINFNEVTLNQTTQMAVQYINQSNTAMQQAQNEILEDNAKIAKYSNEIQANNIIVTKEDTLVAKNKEQLRYIQYLNQQINNAKQLIQQYQNNWGSYSAKKSSEKDNQNLDKETKANQNQKLNDKLKSTENEKSKLEKNQDTQK